MYIKRKLIGLSQKADTEITNFILGIIKSKVYNKFVVAKDLSRNSLLEAHKWAWIKDNKSVPKPIIRKNGRYDILSDGLYLIRFKDNKTYGLLTIGSVFYSRIDEDEIIRDSYKKSFLYIIGKNKRKYMNNFENYIEHQSNSVRNNASRTVMDLSTITLSTRYSSFIQLRSIESIETSRENKNLIINSISRFVSNTDIYNSLEISHKLGIMLYGEPGTGKTSMIKAILNEIDKDTDGLIPSIYKVDCSDPSCLMKLNRLDSGSSLTVVIFEEIDCIIPNREEESDLDSKKALYNLLEFLDGVSNMSNIISIATTNHIEDLDPALLRDGRFDIKVEMGKIDRECAEHMCHRLKLSKEDTDELLDTIEFPVNPSYLQNKILFKL